MEIISFIKKYNVVEEFSEVLDDVLDYHQQNGSFANLFETPTLRNYKGKHGIVYEVSVYIQGTGTNSFVIKLESSPEDPEIYYDVFETERYDFDLNQLQDLQDVIQILSELKPKVQSRMLRF